MENSTEILINWYFIADRFKHVRMFKDGRFIVFEHAPYISDYVWISSVGDCINITGLVTGYILEPDWKTFEATRGKPTEVKMETKKVYYTKKMEDNKEMPLVNMYFVSKDGESKVISTSKHDVGIITYTYLYANSERVGNCKFNPKSVLPIDTRTDEEKLIDDVADFLIEIDEDVLLNDDEDYVHKMAVKLITASKFTITKKGK